MEFKFGTFLVGCVLVAAGVAGGALADRYTLLKCVVEQKEFSAKTVVCDDGQVYRLMATDEVAAEQKLEFLDSRVKALEGVVTPPAKTPGAAQHP